MSIPRQVVEEVLARTDLVELVGRTVTLRRNGRSSVGLCPFHQEKSPSFNVIPHKGIFHCFGCGEGGDAVAWLRKTRGLSFPEAVRELAQAVGITIEERELAPEDRARLRVRADVFGVCEVAERLYHTTLLTSKEGAVGRAYLEQRGFSLATAQKYRIGYAPEGWSRLADHLHREHLPAELGIQAGLLKRADDRNRIYDVFRNRLIFPILDDRDRAIAFGGRILPGGDPIPEGRVKPPKYLNSPESPVYEKSKVLYGLSWARNAIQRKNRVIVVEGYFDAVALWQAGFEETVATCGTALTAPHLEVLGKLTRNVVALFDSDEAGLRAATKAMDLFLGADISASRLDLGDAKDPDEYIQKYGAAAFEALLGKSEPLIQLLARRTFEREGKDSMAKDRVIRALIPHLVGLPEGQIQTLALEIAHTLDVRDSIVLEAVARSRGQRRAAAAPPATPPPARWVPPKEVSHLLWLTIHFPQHVAPALALADPERITDRHEVLGVLARLASGETLSAVVDSVSDDLARTLRAIAAREAEYKEETAASSVRRILYALELPHLEQELRALTLERAACTDPEVKSSYAVRIRALQARKLTLAAARTRSSDPTP